MNPGTHHDQGSNVHWCTPERVKNAIWHLFDGPPDLDPCSNDGSIMGAVNNYTLPNHDGLKDSWDICGVDTKVYINPPFGKYYVSHDRTIVYSAKEWSGLIKLGEVDKAKFERQSISDWVTRSAVYNAVGKLETAMLMPVATDTAQWQDIVFATATSVCYIRGRLQFLGGVRGPCPMPCSVVYWGRNPAAFEAAFYKEGRISHITPVVHTRTNDNRQLTIAV